MTFVLINNQSDGRHVRAFKTEAAALKALAKFMGRPVGDFKVGQTVYDDWGGRLVVEERPSGHTAAREAAFAKAYDAREMGTATKAQLKLLSDIDAREEEIAQFGDASRPGRRSAQRRAHLQHQRG